jgi:hypothetical protein
MNEPSSEVYKGTTSSPETSPGYRNIFESVQANPYLRLTDDQQARLDNLDQEQLRSLTTEHLRNNFGASSRAYGVVVDQINEYRDPANHLRTVDVDQLAEHYEAQLAEWQDNGVVDAIANHFVDEGVLYWPVIRPNIVATVDELYMLALRYSQEKRDHGLPFNPAILERDRYENQNNIHYVSKKTLAPYDSPEDVQRLSGYNPEDGDVAISLVSNRPIGKHEVTLNGEDILQIPSVLEAICLWHTVFERLGLSGNFALLGHDLATFHWDLVKDHEGERQLMQTRIKIDDGTVCIMGVDLNEVSYLSAADDSLRSINAKLNSDQPS